MNWKAFAGAAALVLGLPALAGPALARPRVKLYTVVVTGSAHQASHDSGTEDFSGQSCTEFHTTTYTTAFSARLAKPSKVFALPWGEDVKIRLVKPKASWVDALAGTTKPKFAGAQCTFKPSRESGTCTPNFLATDPRGVVFAAKTSKGGRLKLIQDTGNSGIFTNTGGEIGDGCRAESRISNLLSGGFLDHPGIQTTLKVSSVKALKAGRHVTAKGSVTSSVTARTFGGAGHFKNTVAATYKITVTRTR
jgi:hypothetical protein